jgi:branched-chain amino acid transport system ATP-binding protein
LAPLLEVDQIEVSYGAVKALHGVSLSVETGQVVTLLGANGAGKSTTLRTISRLLKPTKGCVRFEGKDLAAFAPHQLLRLGIAHVPEGRGIFPVLTVLENLHLGAYAKQDRSTVVEDLDRVFSLFPRIAERRTQLAGTLSGGEQQMLAIGRALLSRPKLLLLDEPSLGLAPQIVQVIFQIIGEINRSGTTILLVEQNANMALRAAHFGYVLEAGRIVLGASARELEQSGEVRKAYLSGGH